MGIPAGYEKLAAIGIAYKGDYTPGNTYKLLHAVYYSGSTYVALKDDPVGPPVDDKVNWQYMAKGFVEGVMSAINVTDTSGVLGSAGDAVNAQTFIDALADKVMTKLIYQNKIVTDLLATATDTVLSGALGPIIDQRLTDLMNKFALLNGEIGKIKWDEAIKIPGDATTYVAPRNGILYTTLHREGASATYFTAVSVNGMTVAITNMPATIGSFAVPATAIVSAGDVVAWVYEHPTCHSSNNVFVPYSVP